MKCSPAQRPCLDEALCRALPEHDPRTGHAGPGPDRRDGCGDGFSLIELLIVIVVLGILATVVVFSVRGIVDRGEQSSQEIDQRILVTALENYYAKNGVYATEAELVAADYIRGESERHEITLTADRSGYTISDQP